MKKNKKEKSRPDPKKKNGKDQEQIQDQEKIQGPEIQEKTKKDLPDFPKRDQKNKADFIPGTSEDLEPEQPEADVDLIEICKDIISLPFEIWNVANKQVPPLSDGEKKNLSKPLARLVIKYELQKYIKDEFLFITYFSFAVAKRTGIKSKKKEKPSDKDDRGKKRDGENIPSEGDPSKGSGA